MVIYICLWKIVRTRFQRIVVSQLRGDCSRMYDNFMDPGSESRRMIYLRTILTRNDQELLKRVYTAQQDSPTDGDYALLVEVNILGET